jgi:hypothetical protein
LPAARSILAIEAINVKEVRMRDHYELAFTAFLGTALNLADWHVDNLDDNGRAAALGRFCEAVFGRDPATLDAAISRAGRFMRKHDFGLAKYSVAVESSVRSRLTAEGLLLMGDRPR